MNPQLRKQILRRKTAYRSGRQSVDALIVLEVLSSMVLPLALWRFNNNTAMELLAVVAAVGFVLNALLANAVRELVQAAFDAADAKLDDAKD